MDESISQPPAGEAGAFELGEMLGGRRAFSLVAGRCSAADAACLRRMRDEKLYAYRSASWEEFCPKYLGMSKSHANRTIRLLEELGPGYFELAQLTRITPEEYRAIAPAVTEKVLHVNGEAIALISENAEKVAAAVEELRRTAASETPAPPSTRDRLAALERRFRNLVAEFAELSGAGPSGPDREFLASALKEAYTALMRLEIEMGA
jgi:hypothetical protein